MANIFDSLMSNVKSLSESSRSAAIEEVKRRNKEAMFKQKNAQTARGFKTAAQLLKLGGNLSEVFSSNSEVAEIAESKGFTQTSSPLFGIFGEAKFSHADAPDEEFDSDFIRSLDLFDKHEKQKTFLKGFNGLSVDDFDMEFNTNNLNALTEETV